MLGRKTTPLGGERCPAFATTRLGAETQGKPRLWGHFRPWATLHVGARLRRNVSRTLRRGNTAATQTAFALLLSCSPAAADRFLDCGKAWLSAGLEVPVYVIPVRELVYSVCRGAARACLKPPGSLSIPADQFSIWIDETRHATRALRDHELAHIGGLASDHSTGGATSCELGRPGPNDLVNGGAQ